MERRSAACLLSLPLELASQHIGPVLAAGGGGSMPARYLALCESHSSMVTAPWMPQCLCGCQLAAVATVAAAVLRSRLWPTHTRSASGSSSGRFCKPAARPLKRLRRARALSEAHPCSCLLQRRRALQCMQQRSSNALPHLGARAAAGTECAAHHRAAGCAVLGRQNRAHSCGVREVRRRQRRVVALCGARGMPLPAAPPNARQDDARHHRDHGRHNDRDVVLCTHKVPWQTVACAGTPVVCMW